MNLNDGRPIWLQLLDEFTIKIVSKQWPPGQKIPSVRELSTQLGVNPNTVQRALTELDSRQLSLTERTAGRFVTDNQEIIDRAAQQLMENVAESYIKQAFNLHLDKATVIHLLEERWQVYEQAMAKNEALKAVAPINIKKQNPEEEN